MAIARTMSRRQVLLALVGGAGGVGLLVSRMRSCAPRPADLDEAFGLSERTGWRELGRRYLEQFPADRDTGTWVREMTGAGGTGPEAVARAVARAITEDFRGSRTVSVDGWIVSRTEARLAALAALNAGQER